MKKHIRLLVGATLFVAHIFAYANGASQPGLVQSAGLHFIENKGQIHDQFNNSRADVLYGLMTGNLSVHFKSTGLSYQLYRADKQVERLDPKTQEKRLEIEQQTIYRVDLKWLNSQHNVLRREDAPFPGYSNYYLQHCPEGVLYVKSYKGITLENIYEGIDVHYYEKNGELKHDYLVAANANYKAIRIQVEGASVSLNNDGSLLLNTPLGQIQEGAPVVFQNHRQLPARWVLKDHVLSFDIENYNPSLPLVIDPVTRLWGTYYGGGPNGSSGSDYGSSCSTDINGNVYMAGQTGGASGAIIATSGSHQSTAGGGFDAYLVKFNGNGQRQWGTYYGGSTGNEYGYACATDASGDVYMAGSTGTTGGFGEGSVIATPPNCHQPYHGGNWDAFLVKFNTNGVRQWGTYYGGTGDDKAFTCAVDASGNVFIGGSTSSSGNTVIATSGCHQGSYWSAGDGFVAKFNSSGQRQWGSYYGGSGTDEIFGCATDANGNFFFTGRTNTGSGQAIASAGSHQPNSYGGDDAFLVKFNANGARAWATYYGGNNSSAGYGCATDANGNVYMSGYTSQDGTFFGELISTLNAHQPVYGGAGSDGFLVKFNNNGQRQWGTYYGHNDFDVAYGCATDAFGSVYIVGISQYSSGTVIATSDAHQPNFAGSMDSFLAKFNANGVRQWGTYYGGTGNETGYGCTVDPFNDVYITGWSSTFATSSTAIATSNGHQPYYGGGSFDAFLAKFNPCNPPAQPGQILGDSVVCVGTPVLNYSISEVPDATSYNWELPSDWTGASASSIISASPGSTGVFTVTAYNGCGASLSQTLSIAVKDCTGMSELNSENQQLGLFPNPNNGLFYVETTAACRLELRNALGQLVVSKSVAAGRTLVNVQELSPGVYFLKASGSHLRNTVKLLIE